MHEPQATNHRRATDATSKHHLDANPGHRYLSNVQMESEDNTCICCEEAWAGRRRACMLWHRGAAGTCATNLEESNNEAGDERWARRYIIVGVTIQGREPLKSMTSIAACTQCRSRMRGEVRTAQDETMSVGVKRTSSGRLAYARHGAETAFTSPDIGEPRWG